MNWIRISVAIADDPRLHLLAERLSVRLAEAIGLVVALLTHFPEHAPKGDLSAVADSLLEKWATWEGRRGRFATEFRATFLGESGVWAAWEKHNGAAQREHVSNRLRAQARRDKSREQLDLTLNGTAKSTPDGTEYGTPDGAALRTNERTKSSTAGAHARGNGHGTDRSGAGALVPIRPHLPAVAIAPPFCAECGPGVLVEVPGQKRGQITHAETCPNRLRLVEVTA